MSGHTPIDLPEDTRNYEEDILIPSEEANDSKEADVLHMSVNSRSESCEKSNPQQPLSHNEVEEIVSLDPRD